MTSSFDLTKKTFIVVTGASQGIGRAIAVHFSKSLGKESAIVLIARSEIGLNETKQLILKNSDICVKIVPLDLSKPDLEMYNKIIDANVIDSIEQAIIFHNAGQMGILKKTTDLIDIHSWRNYYDLNVFSVALLNSVFYNKLQHIEKVFVVNISSLCGRQPFHNLAMYGSAKAARDLYFRVFAVEESRVRILNYSPGPVDTDLIDEILAKAQSPELKDTFTELKEKNNILTPFQTTEKLLNILKLGKFKSGDVIDYYDEI